MTCKTSLSHFQNRACTETHPFSDNLRLPVFLFHRCASRYLLLPTLPRVASVVLLNNDRTCCFSFLCVATSIWIRLVSMDTYQHRAKCHWSLGSSIKVDTSSIVLDRGFGSWGPLYVLWFRVQFDSHVFVVWHHVICMCSSSSFTWYFFFPQPKTLPYDIDRNGQ